MESQPQYPEFRNNPENFHPCSTTPHMESITVSTNSITKLLKDLKPHKAAGPNQIKRLVLQSKKEGKDQEPTQSSTKPDPGYQWESDNFTINLDTTNESQEVSPFPAGDHKASINRHARKHKKSRQK